jgi:hypothetical protein
VRDFGAQLGAKPQKPTKVRDVNAILAGSSKERPLTRQESKRWDEAIRDWEANIKAWEKKIEILTRKMIKRLRDKSYAGQRCTPLFFKDLAEKVDSLRRQWTRSGTMTNKMLKNLSDEAAAVVIISIAAKSEIARFPWKLGPAPPGYIKGMALVYARVYCKLKAGDPAAMEMAKPIKGNDGKDALAHFAPEFKAAGLGNNSTSVDILRHLFVLLIGLGMRESSGRVCQGCDKEPGSNKCKNPTADTAEAGLFQTSFNAVSANPLMQQLFQQYRVNPSGFLEIFREGVSCIDKDFEDNVGSGVGREFQRLSKTCPAFAAEFTAIALRNLINHWGPIFKKRVEICPECDAMLLQVQKAVDKYNLCPALQ